MKYLLNAFGRLLFVMVICLGVFSTGYSAETEENSGTAKLIVYKDPQCGCCGKWVKHMRMAGFDVRTKNTNNMTAVKNKFGIKPQHRSCHTAVAVEEGFIFEGHIPASIIKQFLASPPENAKGLIVPGMPAGSPGMEVAGQKGRYDILLIRSNGDVETFLHVDEDLGT